MDAHEKKESKKSTGTGNIVYYNKKIMTKNPNLVRRANFG